MELFRVPRIFAIAGVLSGAIFAGCSTGNFIVSEWRNPAYVAPEFKSVMVGGLTEQASIRRNFEDEFLAQLRANGIDALPSYRHLAEGEKLDEATLKQAARKAGADALIIARPVKVEQKTDFGPNYPVPSFGIFGSNVGAVWHGGYGGGSVSRYTEYTSEATLFDLVQDQVVWSGTLKTSEPENVNRAVKLYVESVINALKEKDLLRVRK